MDSKLHLLETFYAQDDQGTSYKICGYEHLVQVPLVATAVDQWEPTGVAEYRLSGGEHLEQNPDGSFRVAASGLRLNRR